MQPLIRPIFIVMGKFIDLTGRRFGSLIIIERGENNKFKNATWICLCDCGSISTPTGSQLIQGKTRSCGCLKSIVRTKMNITHGDSIGKPTPEYRAWLSIKERCLNDKSKSFKDYGGRGIKIFDGWVNDFNSFIGYIGRRPSPKHSVDRYPDNNGHYEPGNIRWATQKQQCNNQRKNVFITHCGVTMILMDWAKHFNVAHAAIQYHLKKGRTIEQIVRHYEYKKLNNLSILKWKSFSH